MKDPHAVSVPRSIPIIESTGSHVTANLEVFYMDCLILSFVIFKYIVIFKFHQDRSSAQNRSKFNLSFGKQRALRGYHNYK